MEKERGRARQQIGDLSPCPERPATEYTHTHTFLFHSYPHKCSLHNNVPGEGNWAFTVAVRHLKGGIVFTQRDELIYSLNRMIRKWRGKVKEGGKKEDECVLGREGSDAPVSFRTNVNTHLLGKTLEMLHANLQ